MAKIVKTQTLFVCCPVTPGSRQGDGGGHGVTVFATSINVDQTGLVICGSVPYRTSTMCLV